MIRKIKIRGYRIHKDLTVEPNRGFNLIVGANESGKSTLMEAIALALTGRINGRSAAEELNPHWFNTDVVREFIEKRTRRCSRCFPGDPDRAVLRGPARAASPVWGNQYTCPHERLPGCDDADFYKS